MVIDDELVWSFRGSGRFDAVLPGDHASGLRLGSPARAQGQVTKAPSLGGV